MGEHCVNSVLLLRTDLGRILLAIYNQDQEGGLSGLAVLREALFALSGLWLQGRGLLGISQCYSISGAGTRGGTRGGAEFHRDLCGHSVAVSSLPSSGNECQELTQMSPRNRVCVPDGRLKSNNTWVVSHSGDSSREGCYTDRADDLGSGWVGPGENAVMRAGHQGAREHYNLAAEGRAAAAEPEADLIASVDWTLTRHDAGDPKVEQTLAFPGLG